ncbi:MAG: hypothetical protein ACYCTE_04595 [Acidimicrobiales bacterium]
MTAPTTDTPTTDGPTRDGPTTRKGQLADGDLVGGDPERPRRRRRHSSTRRSRRRERRRARRTVVGRHPVATIALVVLAGLTPVWVSFANALGDPGLGSSLPARIAEWVREHGGASIVVTAERIWYSHHQPPVGGRPAPGAIPAAPRATTATQAPRPSARPGSSPAAPRGIVPLPAPANLVPFASPAIPGEGVWHAMGRPVDGHPAVFEAFLRPDAIHTSLVVGVAWMDTKLLAARLYSGSSIPGGGPYPYTAPVLPKAAKTLVAAFNAGFLMGNANGGYYTDHKTVLPLRTGAASFVELRNGDATVEAWPGPQALTPDVVSVRQNLDLLVSGGKPVPGLNANDTTVWGATLGNQIYVWRSGLGVTRDGALVYVGGPGLNITSLAALLVRAGAVRGMELDINTDWVNYSTYRPSSPTGLAAPSNGTPMLPAMSGGPARYFASWWTRDFITMSARTGPNGGG